MGRGGLLKGVPESLWRRAALARRRLLMLDYDGTLAPFQVDPARALPSPAAVDRLHRIAASARTRLAIVSGRPVESLVELLRGLDALFVGGHGWERWRPGEGAVRVALEPAAAEALARAVALAEASGIGKRLERKYASIVVHTRGLPETAARAAVERAEESWRPLCAPAGPLGIRPIHGGIELRASGRDKGTAARDLLAGEPEGTLPIYVGDDETDEDAFRAISACGFGIRVGPEDTGTSAAGMIPSCAGVDEFLGRWVRDVEEGLAARRSAGEAPPGAEEGGTP